MSFGYCDTPTPEKAARDWLEQHRREFPDGCHKHYEVRQVVVQSPEQQIMAAAAAELARLQKALYDIAYSGRTKTGMKESARAALFAKIAHKPDNNEEATTT